MNRYGIVTEAYGQVRYSNEVAVKRATFYQSHMLEIRRGWHYSTDTSCWSNFTSNESVCLLLWLLEAEVDCGHRVAFFLFVRVLRLHLLLQLSRALVTAAHGFVHDKYCRNQWFRPSEDASVDVTSTLVEVPVCFGAVQIVGFLGEPP